MGLWSISIILSIFSKPSILRYGCGLPTARKIMWLRIGYRVPLINVDFPLPLTPVIHVNTRKGIFKSTFFRLFPVAPKRPIQPSAWRLTFGTPMPSWPFKYFAVMLSLARISERSPCATIAPPCTPARGPISRMWSAVSIISRSCSTTKTLLPISRNCCRESMSLALSRWCNPIEGSSKMYRTFTNCDPIWVANRIRCASPPLRLRALRFKFK